MTEKPGFEQAAAPRNSPLSYPGVWPSDSVLIGNDEVWNLLDADGLKLGESREGPGGDGPQRLSSCRVEFDEAEASDHRLSGAVFPHLVNVLERKFSVSVDARVPVLAIGSNAAPSQLRSKFRSSPSSLLIPSVLARVEGVSIAYCAFVAFYGAIPATIIRNQNSTLRLAVQFLDERQLAEIDGSESPAYHRVWLDEGVRVTLETGEELPGVYAYVAAGGFLADGERPLLMRTPDQANDSALDQTELLDFLLRDSELRKVTGGTPQSFVTAAQRNQKIVTAALQRSGFARTENELFDLPDQIGKPVRRYGALMPRSQGLPVSHDPTVSFGRCMATPDGIDRGGLSVVRLPASVHASLGEPSLVEVSSHHLGCRLKDRAPTALAAVLVKPQEHDQTGVVEVDHVLRMATGLHLGDVVQIRSVILKRSTMPDWLLGKPTYLSMRVTLADTSSAERDVVLMSRLSLELLGLCSGDYVILEGAAGEHGIVKSLRLKAFEAPSEVLQQRASVTGGTWGARFPDARDAFGVDPDLPLIFIDSEIRSRLGIARKTLASVRARPSRLQQFFGEVRKMLNVLAVAFISVVILVPDPWIGALLIGLLVVGSFGLVLNKMRRTLSHQLISLSSRRQLDQRSTP